MSGQIFSYNDQNNQVRNSIKNTPSIKTLTQEPINPGLNQQSYCPNISDISKAQKSTSEHPPVSFKEIEKIFSNGNGVIGIPSEDNLLKLCILRAARTRKKWTP